MSEDVYSSHIWHPFTPMQAFERENAPVIERADGFFLIDTQGNRYLDGVSSLWCNVHGHRVPEIDQAIRDQLDRVAHSTLLGLSSPPAIELAERLVKATPQPLTRVFYSDSGATAVEAALKICVQYHSQKRSGPESRRLFATVGGAYHGDTFGSISVGRSEVFHRPFQGMLFETVSVPSPVTYRIPEGQTVESFRDHCFREVERVVSEHAEELAGFIIEPLVQGAAGMLVHPPGYLRHVREVTRRHNVPLIADEVAVGFGRTGTLFACEQEDVAPDLMCLAKGITGGYLPLAATLATDEIYNAFLGEPHELRTFFHGHTYTGNPLGCAAALASLKLLEANRVLDNVQQSAGIIRRELAPLSGHPHVGEVRHKGVMVGIELVEDCQTKQSFPYERRTGHRVTLEARKRGCIVRPLADTVILMPAPAMPGELVERLCRVVIESIDAATA